MLTGILIYLYKRRALHSLIVRNLNYPPKWFVLFIAVHHLESSFECNPFFFPLCKQHGISSTNNSHIFAALPDLGVNEMIDFFFVLFCLFVPFCLLFFSSSSSVFHEKDRDQPATVRAKMNCKT